MKLTKKQTYISLAVLGLLLAVGAGATTLPLIHPGQTKQISTKLAVGTQTAGSSFSVAGGNGQLQFKKATGSNSNTLAVENNAIAIGDIRVGDSVGDVSDNTHVTDGFIVNTGISDLSTVKNSLRYPTSVVTGDPDDDNGIDNLAPQQSVNVHGKIVLEGVKAQNAATASDPLCVTPKGTITRCSLDTGLKWIKTGWSGCEETTDSPNNTITNPNNHNIPFACSVVEVYEIEAEAYEDVQYNELERKTFADLSSYVLDAFTPVTAHAAPIPTVEDVNGVEWIQCPGTPSDPGGGYSGLKTMGFACYNLNSCSTVSEQDCIDQIGPKPSYQASCSTAANDTFYSCHDFPGNSSSCQLKFGTCMMPVSDQGTGLDSGYGICNAVFNMPEPDNPNQEDYFDLADGASYYCEQFNGTSESECEDGTNTVLGVTPITLSVGCNWFD